MLWLTLIAIESTPWFSAQDTGHMLYSLVASLFASISPEHLTLANGLLRKIGHVTGYGILSWLLFRAWRATLRSPRVMAWALSWSAFAFLMTAAVAGLDEWHQTFLPSRTGTIRDVFLDSLAALAVQFFLFTFLWNRHTAETRVGTGALACAGERSSPTPK
jgi:VanZ family protein